MVEGGRESGKGVGRMNVRRHTFNQRLHHVLECAGDLLRRKISSVLPHRLPTRARNLGTGRCLVREVYELKPMSLRKSRLGSVGFWFFFFVFKNR